MDRALIVYAPSPPRASCSKSLPSFVIILRRARCFASAGRYYIPNKHETGIDDSKGEAGAIKGMLPLGNVSKHRFKGNNCVPAIRIVYRLSRLAEGTS
jgi:hypothetical protein